MLSSIISNDPSMPVDPRIILCSGAARELLDGIGCHYASLTGRD